MSTPIYTYCHLEDMPENELRARIVMLRMQDPRLKFEDHHWSNLRIDSQLFDIEDEAIQHIQGKVSDLRSCCAVRYRVSPDSTRLRGAMSKLNNLVRMLGTPGNTLRLERKIVLQREKIVNIKLELAPRSTITRWLVGGLLMG
jgi:hypothetical protein